MKISNDSLKQTFYQLLVGLITALFFSVFIYLSDFGIEIKLLNTINALIAFWLLLHIPKRALLFAGFFIGIFWFYWISYSFKYTGSGAIAPFVVIGFGIVYMLFFGVLALSDKPYIRALLLFGLSFVEPMHFNWMQLSLPFVESYIGIYKWQLAVVLIALSGDSFIKEKRYKLLPLLLLLGALNYHGYMPREDAPLKIKLVQTDIKQDQKWTKEALRPTIMMIYNEVQKAAKEGYDLVVLPESVAPLYLNKVPKLIEQLQYLSTDIDIVLGALLYEDGKNYNVAYHFDQNGNYEIAKKVVLVPFGEYIPLPKFMQKWVNETFFDGASDFVTAKNPTDFMIKGVEFRMAICYEATTQRLYKGSPKYMIAISNNAWFAPSIEPTLQNLLLRYYARKNGTTIYHSANYRGTGIVK
ncbi:Apolipoprotein N-acyltransferase [hydrothermal vent metagenome]|uniref:Apolipoprotein N-acyltransferase n=1 Tax=hydrothermal vent metagenome TaxID=652676 RepID=A0A1W1BYB1_9ZZZZ